MRLSKKINKIKSRNTNIKSSESRREIHYKPHHPYMQIPNHPISWQARCPWQEKGERREHAALFLRRRSNPPRLSLRNVCGKTAGIYFIYIEKRLRLPLCIQPLRRLKRLLFLNICSRRRQRHFHKVKDSTPIYSPVGPAGSDSDQFHPLFPPYRCWRRCVNSQVLISSHQIIAQENSDGRCVRLYRPQW